MKRPFQVKLTKTSLEDIGNILAYTRKQFGQEAQRRYRRLIQQAILDIGENPQRPGTVHRPELIDNGRTYHLIYSRQSIKSQEEIVKKPRHFLLFRISKANKLELGRVLHDSMDLKRHLPEEYRNLP